MTTRRAMLATLLGAPIAAVTTRRPALALVRLRIDTRGGVCADEWHVFDADTGHEIGRDMPAARWATRVSKARIGEPFHFTVFQRDEKGRIKTASGRTVQERRRGVVVEKT